MPPSVRVVQRYADKVLEQRELVRKQAKERCVAPAHLAHKCIEVDLTALLSGVYFLLRGQEIVYIGSSVSVAARLGGHVREGRKDFNRAIFLPIPEKQLLAVEGALIRFFRPEYNGQAPAYTGRDDRILKELGLPKMDPEIRKLMSMKLKLERMRTERREFNELELRDRMAAFGDYKVPGDKTFRNPPRLPRPTAPIRISEPPQNENTFVWRGKVRPL